jgi:lipoprotein signal peptidase
MMIYNISQIKLQELNSIPSKVFAYARLIGLEGIIWIAALFYFAFFVNPFETHFTICPLANAGFEYCPGCGLGNSISLFFHGYFAESFNTHILGMPALIIIFHRIYSVIKFNLKKEKTTI